MLSAIVLAAFLWAETPAKREELKATIGKYVKLSEYVERVKSIDVKDIGQLNRRKPTNLFYVCNRLAAFDSFPGLGEQIGMWLTEHKYPMLMFEESPAVAAPAANPESS